MRKKIIAFFLCTCTAATLFGCGSTKASSLVTLGDYNKLEVEVDKNYEITDDSVKETIESYFLSSPMYAVDESKSVVADGDIVNIDYSGTQDGEEFDGGSAEGYNLEIGSGTFVDGFESGLVGTNVGESKDLNLTFPEDYSNTDLAGKDVVFHVTVNSIQSESYPTYDTMTDDYVKENYNTYYGVSTVDELKDYVSDYLESSKDSAVAEALTEKLKDSAKFKDIPDSFLKERTDELKSYYKGLAKSQDQEFEDFLTNNYGMTEDDFNDKIDEMMPDYIKSDLVWEAIAEKEGIKASGDDYDSFVTKMMNSLSYDTKKELFEVYPETMVQRMFIEQEAKDAVAKKAKITYVDSSELEDTDSSDDADTTDETTTDETTTEDSSSDTIDTTTGE